MCLSECVTPRETPNFDPWGAREGVDLEVLGTPGVLGSLQVDGTQGGPLVSVSVCLSVCVAPREPPNLDLGLGKCKLLQDPETVKRTRNSPRNVGEAQPPCNFLPFLLSDPSFQHCPPLSLSLAPSIPTSVFASNRNFFLFKLY